MEKKLDSCVMLTLLLTSMLTLAFSIQPIKAEPKTWTVDDDGPADFSRIQDSINAASDRDIIYVYNGTYYENIAVNKAVSLIGENRSITIIDGGGTGNVILVTADNVSISGFKIQNSGEVYPNAGIFLDYSVIGSTIVNNYVSNNNGFGIFVMWANDNNVSNNLVTFNRMNGIRVDVSRNILTDNVVNFNGRPSLYESGGIFLYGAFDCLIENNTASNNAWNGIAITGMSNNITIRDNTARDNERNGIFHYGSLGCSIEANTMSNNGYNGIFIDFSDNNSISHNTITSNNQHGIWLSGSSNNTISGNNITKNNRHGIRLYASSDYNSVSENNTTQNGQCGILLHTDSDYNSISRNNIKNNNMWGIGLIGWAPAWSSYNTIFGNNITSNENGIYLLGSQGNLISGNSIKNSQDNGIKFDWCLPFNNIVGNDIANNWCGIEFLYSSNNILFHNNFIDNTQQVYDYSSDHPEIPNSINVWDYGYPSGGNYWSDHVTVDDCCGVNQDEPGSDGIVDEPYIIDDYNRDHYPLAQPWSPTISATVDIDPDTLNLESKGRWITAYVELPEAYDVYDIDFSSIMLNDTIPVEIRPAEIGDFDNDGIPDLMVKFDRAAVESFILDHISLREAVRVGFTTVTLTITGDLIDGTPFQGSDTIKIICTPPQKL